MAVVIMFLAIPTLAFGTLAFVAREVWLEDFKRSYYRF